MTSFKGSPKKILIPNLSPGACVFCGTMHRVRNMDDKYKHYSQKNTYYNMLLQCYNMELINIIQEKTNCKICSRCGSKLRKAFLFRKQIESVAESFQDILYDLKNDVSCEQSMEIIESDLETSIKTNSNLTKETTATREWFSNDLVEYKTCSLSESSNNDHDSVPIDINSETTSKSKLDVIPPLDPFTTTCPICQESFLGHQALLRHHVFHFPNFLCETCGKAYLTRELLRSHMNVHSEVRHNCEICKKTYANIGSLKIHIKVAHYGEKRYRCVECPEKFSDFSERNKHITEVHRMECLSYPCSFCPRVFYRSLRRNAHEKIHQTGLNNYICKQCGCSFYKIFELRNHMQLHSEIKDTEFKSFDCNKCDKTFCRKQGLGRHILKYHPGQSNSCLK